MSRAHNAITASGRVERVERAFQTEIHMYAVAGEMHYANATEPTLPSALEGIVVAIHGLHNFRLRPRSRMIDRCSRRSPRKSTTASRTSPRQPSGWARSDSPPSDRPRRRSAAASTTLLPTISPGSSARRSRRANTDTDDSPYSVVIVGQSQIDPSRLEKFRRRFELGDPQLTITPVPNSLDPGTRPGDDQQSELDLAWASAVAPRSSLQFVYSDDVTDAVQYAVDQNLAPVLGMSYGECLTSSPMDVQVMRTWAKQANAQGIRWVSGSGDSGAGGCYQSTQGQ